MDRTAEEESMFNGTWHQGGRALLGHRPFAVLADYLPRRGIADLRAGWILARVGG